MRVLIVPILPKQLVIRSYRHDTRGLFLALDMLPSAPRRFSQMLFTHNVVTIKQAPGFVATKAHCHPLMAR